MENNIFPSWAWLIITSITNLSAIVIGIISWIKSAKMMPRELKKAELENKKIELSIAEQFDDIATKAAMRAVNAEERLQAIEDKNKILTEQIEEQRETILSQSAIIGEQSRRLDEQEYRLQTQTKEITELNQELTLSQAYNAALINQIRKENITPIDISTINIEEYKSGINGEVKPKRSYRKKTSNKNDEK